MRRLAGSSRPSATHRDRRAASRAPVMPTEAAGSLPRTSLALPSHSSVLTVRARRERRCVDAPRLTRRSEPALEAAWPPRSRPGAGVAALGCELHTAAARATQMRNLRATAYAPASCRLTDGTRRVGRLARASPATQRPACSLAYTRDARQGRRRTLSSHQPCTTDARATASERRCTAWLATHDEPPNSARTVGLAA